MTKGQFIARARLAHVNRTLSQSGYEIVIKGGAANIILYDPVTMRELYEPANADPSVEVSFLYAYHLSLETPLRRNVSEYYRTNILCFTGKDEREVLYLPGDDDNAFREFKDAEELKTWFDQQIKGEESRNAILQHFSLVDRQKGVKKAFEEWAKREAATKKVNKDGIRYYNNDLKIYIKKKGIQKVFTTKDAFSALTRLTKERMAQETDALICSNGEIILEQAYKTVQTLMIKAYPAAMITGPVGIFLGNTLSAIQLGISIARLSMADTPDDLKFARIDVSINLLTFNLAGSVKKAINKKAVNSATPLHSTRLY